MYSVKPLAGVFIVNFEHIPHLVSIVNFEQVNADWGILLPSGIQNTANSVNIHNHLLVKNQ